MVGKASTRAKNKYNAANYDRFLVVVPKGRKADFSEHIRTYKYDSLNAFVVRAIEEKIQRDKEEKNETDTP